MEPKTINDIATLLYPKSFEDIIRENIDDEFQWDYNVKKFEDMNLGDLDIIEIIMNIEKIYDCLINDELGDYMLNMNPQEIMLQYRRNKCIEELGI
jgi:hypothetical protein